MADINELGPDDDRKQRPGFLPIETNTFDRVFIAVIILVAIHLLWMRFLEAALPLYWATVLSVVVGGVIVMRG